MHGREVGAAVVGEDALDADAVAVEEGDRSLQESDRGRGLFVGEHFGVGEPAEVVDGDVDELPADRAAPAAAAVGAPWPIAAGNPAADAFAGAALDPAELFGVDVDELAGAGALVSFVQVEVEVGLGTVRECKGNTAAEYQAAGQGNQAIARPRRAHPCVSCDVVSG